MKPDDFDGELRWATIEPELKEFQQLLASTVPQLRIERQSDVPAWEQKNGVYFLFADNEQLIWIGYTLNGFQNRVASHKRDKVWRWMDLIVFDKNFEFFASALETFLRQRLSPILDGGGKHI
jgi:hypothetical protein